MSVEKFSGTFSSESNGVTVLVNSVIQSIRDFSVLGLYTYLASKPDTWEPNAKELMKHVGCSKDKIYRLINALIKERLMSVKEVRSKGKFAHYSYTIHLHRQPCPENQEPVKQKPCPENQEMVESDVAVSQTSNSPCPENQDAYKTKILKIKEVRTYALSVFQKFKIEIPERKELISEKIIEDGLQELESQQFTLENYLKLLTTLCANWIANPWQTKTGKWRRNSYEIIMNPINIRKAINGEFKDK